MNIFKNFHEIAKEKAGHWGKIAKDFASETIFLEADAQKSYNSQLIEDLNSNSDSPNRIKEDEEKKKEEEGRRKEEEERRKGENDRWRLEQGRRMEETRKEDEKRKMEEEERRKEDESSRRKEMEIRSGDEMKMIEEEKGKKHEDGGKEMEHKIERGEMKEEIGEREGGWKIEEEGELIKFEESKQIEQPEMEEENLEEEISSFDHNIQLEEVIKQNLETIVSNIERKHCQLFLEKLSKELASTHLEPCQLDLLHEILSLPLPPLSLGELNLDPIQLTQLPSLQAKNKFLFDKLSAYRTKLRQLNEKNAILISDKKEIFEESQREKERCSNLAKKHLDLSTERKELADKKDELEENLKKMEEKQQVLIEKYQILLDNQRALVENQKKAEEGRDTFANQVRQLEEEKKRLLGVNGKFQNSLKEVLGKFYAEMKEERRTDGVKPSEVLLEFERIVNWIGEIRRIEKEKQDSLISNFTKIQAECRDLNKADKDNKQHIENLKKQTEKLSEDNSNLTQQNNNKDIKIKDLQKSISEFTDNRKSFVEELKGKAREIETLKSKIKILEEEAVEMSSQLEHKTEEASQFDSASQQLLQKNEELSIMKSQLTACGSEIGLLQNSLSSLQAVHEDALQRADFLARKYDSELKRLRSEIETLQVRVSREEEVELNLREAERKYADLERKEKEMERRWMTAEQEKEDIKKEAVALIKKIKGEAAYRENLVDKRVVSKFLVNYFEPNTNYHVKLQILETLSSILSFTNEERVKIGLHKIFLEKQIVKSFNEEKEEDSELKGKSVTEGETLKDKFLIYLMNDEDDE